MGRSTASVAPTHRLSIELRRGRRLPTVVPTDSRPLSWPPIGALPRNRLASSATGGASPISPPAGDRKGRPYGGLQVVQGAGRCRYRPLRRGTRNAVRRGVCVEENSEKRKSKKPIAFAIGFLVGDGGFEPPKASPADLQSVPFGHSGNPPYYL